MTALQDMLLPDHPILLAAVPPGLCSLLRDLENSDLGLHCTAYSAYPRQKRLVSPQTLVLFNWQFFLSLNTDHIYCWKMENTEIHKVKNRVAYRLPTWVRLLLHRCDPFQFSSLCDFKNFESPLHTIIHPTSFYLTWRNGLFPKVWAILSRTLKLFYRWTSLWLIDFPISYYTDKSFPHHKFPSRLVAG